MDKQEPVALKPCPFCGTVMHQHQHCFSHPFPVKGDCILRHYSFDNLKIEDWNTRANRPADDGLEASVRIAVWNACRTRGQSQDVALKFVREVMADPALSTALRAQSDAHGPDGLPVDTSGERAAYLAGYEVGKLEAADSAQSDAEVEREVLRGAIRDLLAIGPDHENSCSIGPIYNCTCDLHPARQRARQALERSAN